MIFEFNNGDDSCFNLNNNYKKNVALYTFTTKKVNHVKDGAKFYIGKKSYEDSKTVPKLKKKIF